MKRSVFLFSFFFFLFSVVPLARAASPHLSLQPASSNWQGTFEVEVRIDAAGETIGGADIALSFPKEMLVAEGFTKGTAFPEVLSFPKNEEGKWRLAAYFPLDRAGEFFEGSDGLIGKLKFKATASGRAAVNFLCENGKAHETNLVSKITSTDIVVCSANVGGSYQVSPASSSVAPTPAQTATPTATVLPKTAIVSYTLGLVGIAFITILTGLILASQGHPLRS